MSTKVGQNFPDQISTKALFSCLSQAGQGLLRNEREKDAHQGRAVCLSCENSRVLWDAGTVYGGRRQRGGEGDQTCWRVVRVCWPHSTKAAVAPSMPSARALQSHPSRARVNIISFLLAIAAWCMGVPAPLLACQVICVLLLHQELHGHDLKDRTSCCLH